MFFAFRLLALAMVVCVLLFYRLSAALPPAAGDPERNLGQAGRRANGVGLPSGGGQLRGSDVIRRAPASVGEYLVDVL